MNICLKRIALTSFAALVSAHAVGCLEHPIGLVEPVTHNDASDDSSDPHSCVDDDDCADGFGCWAGCCEPEFNPSSSASGNAGGSGGATASTTGAGGHPGGDPTCAYLMPNERVVPTIVVLADRSGSMDDPLSGSPTTTRWEALHDALMGDQDAVIPAMEDSASFGVADYTCDDDAPHVTPFTFGDVDAIGQAYQRTASMGSYTPTGEAIERVATDLLDLDNDDPKLILLATDGLANTCGSNSTSAQAVGKARAVAAAEDAHVQGIKTVVLAVSDDIGQDQVDAIANAGAGEPQGGNAKSYRANNQEDLVAYLGEIVAAEQDCVIRLDAPMGAPLLDGTVTLDGEVLVQDAENGWTRRDEQHIELHGTACEAVQYDHALVAGKVCSAF